MNEIKTQSQNLPTMPPNEADFIDKEIFFTRTFDGKFVKASGEISNAATEKLLSSIRQVQQRIGVSPVSNVPTVAKTRKLCVEYCVQVLKSKKVVRIRMKYASKIPNTTAIKIEDAYFMVNASAPQFGGMGCGTFFSETLEVDEIEQPPMFLMNILQQEMFSFMTL